MHEKIKYISDNGVEFDCMRECAAYEVVVRDAIKAESLLGDCPRKEQVTKHNKTNVENYRAFVAHMCESAGCPKDMCEEFKAENVRYRLVLHLMNAGGPTKYLLYGLVARCERIDANGYEWATGSEAKISNAKRNVTTI